jgi:hypothetical protein
VTSPGRAPARASGSWPGGAAGRRAGLGEYRSGTVRSPRAFAVAPSVASHAGLNLEHDAARYIPIQARSRLDFGGCPVNRAEHRRGVLSQIDQSRAHAGRRLARSRSAPIGGSAARFERLLFAVGTWSLCCAFPGAPDRPDPAGKSARPPLSSGSPKAGQHAVPARSSHPTRRPSYSHRIRNPWN